MILKYLIILKNVNISTTQLVVSDTDTVYSNAIISSSSTDGKNSSLLHS